MPVEILVPQMGESIVEATIAQWLKKPGDTVAAGETLVELETDKVNVTIEAESAGVLTGVLASEGATVAVGQSIGTIGGAGESVAAAAPATSAPAPIEKPGPAAPVPAANVQNATPTTPVAQSIADANGVDLTGVAGTGPAGKIGKSDVEAKLSAPQATVTPVATIPTSSVAPTPKTQRPASTRPEERVKMNKRRQTIAANLKHAQNTAAMLTTFNEVDLSRVMELRTRRKADFEKRFGVGLGFMSFFTKAVISALKAFPSVNAEVDGDEIILKKYYDIGIAVGLEDGLVVPVVRDADRLSFAEIEKTIKELAGKARDGKLGIADLTGGTFTITNGGVYGSLMSTPILNHPQVGILGMHTIKERPIVVDGAIAIRPMMNLALSYDHRIIDGSTAVRFLVKVKDLLEDPETLLLEG